MRQAVQSSAASLFLPSFRNACARVHSTGDRPPAGTSAGATAFPWRATAPPLFPPVFSLLPRPPTLFPPPPPRPPAAAILCLLCVLAAANYL